MKEQGRRSPKPKRGRRTAATPRRRRIPWPLVAVAAALLVVLFLIARSLEIGAPGERIATSGVGQHIPEGQPIEYPTYPPVGGAHWPSPASWGASTSPVADERAVHNLEHGGVVISYNGIPSDVLAKLVGLQGTLPRSSTGNIKVLIRPYDRIPAGSIALTAWGWRQMLGTYDESAIRGFIEAHIGRCCENVP